MFAGKDRSPPKSGVPERYLTNKHEIRLERLARDKYSTLLRTFKNYSCKLFYNIGPSTFTKLTLFMCNKLVCSIYVAIS
jgi:hypothetical protein